MLDFAPDEACLSITVAGNEVGSYPAFSPLPFQAVCFLRRCLSPVSRKPGNYPASCPAEPGLSSSG